MSTHLLCLLLIGQPVPDEAAANLVTSRFASAPDFSSPTGLAVTPDGVVFVSCDPNGSTGRQRDVGYIVRCEDTSGDGTADHFTRFVDRIDSPRGCCWLGGTLYVMQSPQLVAWRDQDGDHVADENRVLVTGLGPDLSTGGIVHGANGICAAIDGWLYLATGDQGCRAQGTDGAQVTMHGGGVLRVRPDGSQLEVVCTGTRNLYDITVDPGLNIYARDNSNDGGGWGTRLLQIFHLADYGYPHLYRQFAREAMPCLTDDGPGAVTAVCSLHEPGFPKHLTGRLLTADFHQGVVVHDLATEPPRETLLLPIPRVVGMASDGQSRLYCVSRQGGGFGPSRHPFGQIDVICSQEREADRQPGQLQSAGKMTLLELLSRPSHTLRLQAAHELVRRPRSEDVIKQLATLATDSTRPLSVRTAAVFTLKRIDGRLAHRTIKPLYDDAVIRAAVVRAVSDVADEIDTITRELCRRALADDNPEVRLAGINGLARCGDPAAAAHIFPLARARLTNLRSSEHSSDQSALTVTERIESHCALAAMVQLKPVPLLLTKLNDAQSAEAALCALQHLHSREVVNGLALRLEQTADTQHVKHIAFALMRLFYRDDPRGSRTWWGNRPHVHGPYRQPVRWDHTADVAALLETAFHKAAAQDLDDLFRGLQRHSIATEELQLKVKYDPAIALLQRKTLSATDRLLLLNAATDRNRSVAQRMQIYRYFAAGPLPQSYHDRIRILRRWGEHAAEHPQQRQAWEQFVKGAEFQEHFETLTPFLGESENEASKYAHLQLLSLLNSSKTSPDTRSAASLELQKTWDEQKKLYPHRLRGLMLALEFMDPAPFAGELQPLTDHRDERVKQPAVRFLRRLEAEKQ